jgi:deoxycytidine triphosphate deaminase
MILSDRTIREEIDSGRIGIDPYDPSMVQPSVDRRHARPPLPRVPQPHPRASST